MFESIKENLKALGCDTFELTQTTVTAWEFYFIRHRLDQNRSTRVVKLGVKLYRPLENGMLGSASGVINPTADDEEVQTALKNIYYQASLVKNPAYTLTDVPLPVFPNREVDIAAIAENFLNAMQAVSETETERINSYEIFVREVRKTFENSNGVSYEVIYPSSMIEVVINASKGEHEIELYRNYTSGVCDPKKLTRDVEEALRFGRDRLIAGPTPKLVKSDVVFSTESAVELYRYFGSRMSAGMQFRKISDWIKGKPVADYTTGDRISLRAVPALENSSRSFPADEQGALIRERYLIRDGIALNTWGDRQMSQYLGEQDSSIVYNFIAEGGTALPSELRAGDYLELCEFSDFQVDPVGGDILGEIRLGYWHHDGKTDVITGGSVSGTMQEAIPAMRFSPETEQYDTVVIPKETRLYGLSITGIR
jgi:Predicted Zn-dependent proteases and their inactivated homologs